MLKTSLRKMCLRLARAVVPASLLLKIGNFVRQLELDIWLPNHRMVSWKVVGRREELFEMTARMIGDLPTLYMEFGVADGDATRYWSKLLVNRESVLHGFDSFEGLPETWSPKRPKGMFSTGGVAPVIDDPRVKFFKGWFDKTLSSYEPPVRPATVINMDADLYSSTAYVLRTLKPAITVSCFLYFDEFSSFGHEERAFREFVDETGWEFTLLGGTTNLLHVLFQRSA